MAIEPLPRNLEFLRRHLALNRVADRVRVLPLALGAAEGNGLLDPSSDPSQAGLRPGGTIPVRIATLDGLVREAALPLPSLIKCDIEGGEGEALEGAREVLASARPTILLSTHGDEVAARCLSILGQLGYTVRRSAPDDYLAAGGASTVDRRS